MTLTWPSVKPTKNALKLCDQNRPENLYHMTYTLLQNFRGLLWPSFDLCTLYMPDPPRVRSIWIYYWCDQIWARSALFSDRQSPECKHAPYVNNFDFDLTCDVIGDHEVNEIRFRSTVLAGLSNAVWVLKIGPVVSEIGGGALNIPPPQSVALWDIPQSGAG